MGNNLPAVSGELQTRDPIAVSGTIVVARTKSGPQYPRPHFQPMSLAQKR